ncbi:MAG: DUF2231 domain-containing protein [Rhodothermales bacterium]
MIPLPDWAPNLHPLIVHFPIGILFTAALFDLVGTALRNLDFPRRAAMMLYVLGGIAITFTWLTGRAAADSVFLPTEANALLTEHADLGTWAFYFFAAYAVVRLITFFAGLEKSTPVRLIQTLVGLGGLALLTVTADHGAEMVFKYGVGVQAVDSSPAVVMAPADSSAFGPQVTDNGGWMWRPTRAAAWQSAMVTSGDLRSSLVDGGERGDVLALSVSDGSAMFWFDQPLEAIQVDASMDLSGFDGTAMLVHHIIDKDNFHFMAVGQGEMRQGHSENGDLYLMDAKPFDAAGWHTYRVVGDQTHFRAYADEVLVTHGHKEAAGSGFVGVRLNGTGTVLLEWMQVQPVR